LIPIFAGDILLLLTIPESESLNLSHIKGKGKGALV
jgi:hypothetical protein